MQSQLHYRLYGAKFKANPYPTYAAMRQEAPLYPHQGRREEGLLWFVTRYEDAESVLRDSKRFVKDFRVTLTPQQIAQLPPQPPLVKLLTNHMLNLDAPDHTRLRSLVAQAFTPRLIHQMQHGIETIAERLLDGVQDRRQMDLVNEYAYPLSSLVIAELLGIPLKDHHRFHKWSSAFIAPRLTATEVGKKGPILHDFVDYMSHIFALRRQQPCPDLISALLQAEDAGDRLDENELYSMLILLVMAGHETSANLIGNAVLALLQHPEQLALLKNNPALMPAAVEEFVRYDGPIERATTRYTIEDVEMRGQTIQRGDSVNVVLASASRDESRYDNPDILDVTRSDNRHLGFGLGIHYCLGAPLGRIEAQVAIEALLRRLPNLRLAMPVDKLQWRVVPIVRGLRKMPVVWD